MTLFNNLNVDYGVPQGSILAPILFSMYVNELAGNISECSLIQNADDTQLLQADTISNLENLISKFEDTIHKARQYFLGYSLMLNPKKTHHLYW